jgi:hypothetical protein
MTAPAVIDLDSAEAIATAPPTRQFIFMVLLLAVKDKANMVRFDSFESDAVPDSDEAGLSTGEATRQPKACRIRYWVAGTGHDMVPAGIPVSWVIGELASMAAAGTGKGPPIPMDDLLRHRSAPMSRRFELKIGSASVQVLAILDCSAQGGSAVLRIGEVENASEQAQVLLHASLGNHMIRAKPCRVGLGLPRMQDLWQVHFPMMAVGIIWIVLWSVITPLSLASAERSESTGFWWVNATCCGLAFIVASCRLPRLSGKGSWSLVRRSRRFLTVSNDRIVLRYAPESGNPADARTILNRADKALANLETRFGPLPRPPFRRRVFVYLFSNAREVAATFGEGYGGAVLLAGHAIVVTHCTSTMDEQLTHEFTHLFTLRWNPWAPPLLSEGLSTWLQGSHWGISIDALARAILRDGEEYLLRRLVNRKFFFDSTKRSLCYLLAASFSGFLLRRFGWDQYRRFYRKIWNHRIFEAKFAKHFGLIFEEAEEQWRQELFQPGAV